MSLYDDLGVDAAANTDEINAAYRKHAKKHHPDAGGDPDAFARLGRAVAILRDPARRAEYDRTGDADAASRANDPDAVARDFLMQSFAAGMQRFIGGGLGDDNVIMTARRDLQAKKRTQDTEIRKAEMTLLTVKGSRSRLTFKGSGDDLLAKLIDAKADELGRIIESMRANVAAIGRALELLDQWEWQSDDVGERQYVPSWVFNPGPDGSSKIWRDRA